MSWISDPVNFLLCLTLISTVLVPLVQSWSGPIPRSNFVTPPALAYVALLFGRHSGLTVGEQWTLVAAVFVGVWGILPYSK
jgi:hypothetical protein